MGGMLQSQYTSTTKREEVVTVVSRRKSEEETISKISNITRTPGGKIHVSPTIPVNQVLTLPACPTIPVNQVITLAACAKLSRTNCQTT
jgi:hypothetical protein